jgi:RNA polymerase sigma-70 factor (ECF subfamily)
VLTELERILDAGLERLPEKCREIFELSRFEGLKNREIAEKLNISVKTVENQMTKALRILKDELKDYLPFLLLFPEISIFRFLF